MGVVNQESLQLQQLVTSLSESVAQLASSAQSMASSQEAARAVTYAADSGQIGVGEANAVYDQAQSTAPISADLKEAVRGLKDNAAVMRDMQQQLVQAQFAADYNRKRTEFTPSENLSQGNMYMEEMTKFAPLAGTAAAKEYLGDVPFSGRQAQGLARYADMSLQYNPSVAATAEFAEQQRDLYQRTQKASLNNIVANKLGVAGGGIARSEFDESVLPMLNDFSANMGTTIDKTAELMKKLRDVSAISADVSSGKASDIFMGLEQLENAMMRFSSIAGSSDPAAMNRAAQNVENLAGSASNTGLAMGMALQASGLSATRQNMAMAGRMAGSGNYRDIASMSAAMYGQRARQTLGSDIVFSRGTDFSDSMLTEKERSLLGRDSLILGSAGDIVNDVYGRSKRFARSDAGYLMDIGDGDIEYGMAKFGEKFDKEQDTAKFLMNTFRDREMSNIQNSGEAAMYKQQEKINYLRDNLGLSDEMATLAAFNGDTKAAMRYSALKDSEGRRGLKFAKDMNETRALYGNATNKRDDSWKPPGSRDIIDYDKYISKSGVWSRVKQIGVYGERAYNYTGDIADDVYRNLHTTRGLAASDAADSAYQSMVGKSAAQAAGKEWHQEDGTMGGQTISLDDYSLSKDGLRGAGGAFYSMRNSGEYSSKYLGSEEASSDLQSLSVISAALQTENADVKLKELTTKVAMHGVATEADIKNALQSITLNYINDSTLWSTTTVATKRTQEVMAYIRKTSIQKLYKSLAKMLPQSNRILLLFQKATGDASGNYVTDKDTALMNLTMGLLGSHGKSQKAILDESGRAKTFGQGLIDDAVEYGIDTIGSIGSVGLGIGLSGSAGAITALIAGTPVTAGMVGITALTTVGAASVAWAGAKTLDLGEQGINYIEEHLGDRFAAKDMEAFFMSGDSQLAKEKASIAQILSYTVSKWFQNSYERIAPILQATFMSYRQAFGRMTQGNKLDAQKMETAKLPESELNEIARRISTNRLNSDQASGESAVRLEKALKTILVMVNQPQSEVGNLIKKGSPTNVTALIGEIITYAKEHEDYNLLKSDSDTNAFQQAMKKVFSGELDGEQLGTYLVQGAMIENSGGMQSMINNLNSTIEDRIYSDNDKMNDTLKEGAKTALTKMSDFTKSRDESSQLVLTGDEIRGFAKATGQTEAQVRRIMTQANDTKEKFGNRIGAVGNFLSKASDVAEDEVNQIQAQAAMTHQVLMKVIDMLSDDMKSGAAQNAIDLVDRLTSG